ncbi:MAG: hypothetical protein S4CHLAM6_03300 [Chlamydiae bacterium]|nr:hypothetical protein [Chlamydiota bacterium]
MINKNLFSFPLFLTTFFLFNASLLHSESISINQNIILEVSKIRAVSINSSTAKITLGNEHISPGDPVFESESYYENTLDITTLSDKPQKITALLSSSLPKGMTLSACLQPPLKGKSSGYQILNTQRPVTLVYAIPKACSAKELVLSYKFSVADKTLPQSADAHVIYKIEDDN